LEFSIDLGKESSMKGKRFTEEQIIAVLKEHEAGAPTKDLCRRHGISGQSRAAMGIAGRPGRVETRVAPAVSLSIWPRKRAFWRALLLRMTREAAGILGARWDKVPERHRPYYAPEQRFRILRIRTFLGLL
jgi:hypothetical protein